MFVRVVDVTDDVVVVVIYSVHGSPLPKQSVVCVCVYVCVRMHVCLLCVRARVQYSINTSQAYAQTTD